VLHTDPWVVFPGNLQGRHIRETGARGALLVTAEEERIVAVDRLFTDVLRWHRLEVDVSAADDLASAVHAVGRAFSALLETSNEGRPLAVRVVLNGRSAAHGDLFGSEAQLRAEILALSATLAGDRAWIEKVRVETTPALDAAAVSDRLPFRIAGFAEGFLIEHTPLSARSIEPVEQFPAIDILLKVFSFALHQHVQNETSLAYQQLLGLCGTDSPLAHYLRQTERSTVLKAAKTLVGELIKLQPDARLNSTTKALQDLAERTTGSASELLVNLNELLDALSDSLLGSPVASPYILLKDRVLKGLKVEISQAASRALLGLCETLILCRRTAQQRNIVERQIS